MITRPITPSPIIGKNVRRCFDKICENFGIVAGLNISEPIQSRETLEELFIAFVDIHTSSHFDISGREVLRCHVKSTKNYKNLRRLIRTRLISSLRDIQDLVEDSLRSLGAKV
ncbi:hypothetical protein LCGC14_0437270 [marine sediment metagenome]|uniref:Uncharacterized protein n=1 Tax=marine sediment metagenome TaxID=412755 RepID=A0A0F9V8E2_9ZZZZ